VWCGRLRSVHQVAEIGAVIVAVVNALAAIIGLAEHQLGRPSRAFWITARTGQALAAIYLVLAGILGLAGWRPDSNLFWIYALVPPAVGYFAEQLRIVAANQVLDRHGYESAAELRAVEDHDERAALAEQIAFEIRLRELGLVAICAGVVAFLAWRAWLTA
jgi:hypothetical protein